MNSMQPLLDAKKGLVDLYNLASNSDDIIEIARAYFKWGEKTFENKDFHSFITNYGNGCMFIPKRDLNYHKDPLQNYYQAMFDFTKYIFGVNDLIKQRKKIPITNDDLASMIGAALTNIELIEMNHQYLNDVLRR